MKALLRQAALLAVAAWLSWWLALRAPPPSTAPRTLPVRAPALELTPLLQMSPDPAPQPVAVELAPPAPLAPPPQRSAALDAPAPAAQADEERLSLPAGPRVARTPPQRSAPAAPPAEAVSAEAPPPAATTAASPRVAAASQAQPEPAPTAESAHASASVAEASEAPLGEAQAEQAEGRPALDVAADAPRPELGAPEGEAERQEREAAGVIAPETPHDAPGPMPARSGVSPGVSPEDAPMRDAALLAEARDEFQHGQKQGFATVLLATTEEQLAIARYFGEELVLVPRRALDPREAHVSYFRVTRGGEARVEEVEAAPALEHYRQYRDLFDYEYGRLPLPLRELRRSVLARGEVYLFAALLSAEEWALVIARRRAALERSGRELSEVRRFVLRYLPLSAGAFDLCVEEIVFGDGTRYRPTTPSAGG